ncbi:MAG TPA: hypothetical protein VKP30_09745, partial [Polyangiaceae bacterium]|nr:hypothetical protein [Polyangiaceae bacterium]
AENPNDKCCYSCDTEGPPAGCAADPVCEETPKDITTNLRCFDQKRRFGHDFLFPTQRYVNALRLPKICPYQNYGTLDCDCKDAQGNALPDCFPGQEFNNPLFDASYSGQDSTTTGRTGASMVFLAGIVGVPWQDIAERDSLEPSAELRYKLSSEIDWDLILPNADGSLARDPLMHEQLEPRSGTHPITNEPIGLPKPGERALNSINWHDWKSSIEPQYACVFDLSQPLSDAPQSGGLAGATRNCEVSCADDDQKCKDSSGGCPCTKDNSGEYPSSPLCQADNGKYGNIQYAARAYPGIRELEVLRGHNHSAVDNSIVASICPKDLDWNHRQSRGYGYNPAVQALVDRLKVGLAATCLPRKLAIENGKVPCAVVEAIPPNREEWAQCADKGRDPVEPALAHAVREGLKADGLCDVGNQPACSELTLCQLRQLADDMHADKPLTGCQNQENYETASPVPGFCYVDPAQHLGSESLVEECPANRRRILRIVGDADLKRAPAPGAWTFIACAGAPNIDRVEDDTPGKIESKE